MNEKNMAMIEAENSNEPHQNSGRHSKSLPDFQQIIDANWLHQKQIADFLEMTAVTFSIKKKDPGKFYVKELLELARLLKIAPEDLLGAIIRQIEGK